MSEEDLHVRLAREHSARLAQESIINDIRDTLQEDSVGDSAVSSMDERRHRHRKHHHRHSEGRRHHSGPDPRDEMIKQLLESYKDIQRLTLGKIEQQQPVDGLVSDFLFFFFFSRLSIFSQCGIAL